MPPSEGGRSGQWGLWDQSQLESEWVPEGQERSRVSPTALPPSPPPPWASLYRQGKGKNPFLKEMA